MSGEWDISSALSASRVLIGARNPTYMELFRVTSNPCISRVYRIHVPEEYCWFSATCSRDTFVAMSDKKDQSVRVHQLPGDLLEEFNRIPLQNPSKLLWLTDDYLPPNGLVTRMPSSSST